MKLINISEIVISPNRQRREFEPASLNEMAESIQNNGLLHPIVIRTYYDPQQRGKTQLVLVAGERRLRAIRDIWALEGSFRYNEILCAGPLVPCNDLGELSPLAAEEAELEENIRRDDLTWQERAEATSRLKRLRDAQALALGNPAPPVAELAVEVRGSSKGTYQEATRRELLVARHLSDPEVAAAKTLDEGFKVLKRKEETRRNTALAESVGATFSSKSHTALCEDALVWLLAEEHSEKFDVILTDPPYGIGADEFGDSGGAGGSGGGHGYTDSLDNFYELLKVCATHFIRVAKPQAHLYWFCDIDHFYDCKDMFVAAGWQVFRTPLIYHKPNAARAPWPQNGPQRQYDLILYAVKGKKFVNHLKGDVLIYPPDKQLGHAAQKPVNLFIDLLARSIHPGDRVLDPFCGSGPIFPAAHELKVLATGIEQDPASYGIALARLKALDQQLALEV